MKPLADRLTSEKKAAPAWRLVPPGVATALPLGLVSAILAFLAALLIALGLAGGRLADTWAGPQENTAMLQIFADASDVEEQARSALDVLRDTPGVTGVRMIEVVEQRALLEPWLGSEAAVDALPLPLMIEVSTDPVLLDVNGLKLTLSEKVPSAVYDDYGAWRAPLVAGARGLHAFAFVMLGFVALVQAAVFGLAAQAALAANGQTVDTLRLVGARDAFITSAFGPRFLLPALAGALAGTAVAAALLALLPAGSEPGFFLIGIGLRGWHWALLLLVPLAAGLIARFSARYAIRRGLRRRN